jgi:hypothetical protein
MWFPVAFLLLGKGEARGTGAVTAMVGVLTLIAAIIQAAVFKDPWIATLLFVYGVFYNSVAYALLTGLEDWRSTGNVSLTVALVSIVYTILAYTGGPVQEGGQTLIAKNNFLALACAGYTVLYVMVWLNAYGKLSAKILAWSLIIWTVVGLWIPGFWLLALGRLPLLG